MTDRDPLDPDAIGLAADAAALCDAIAQTSVPPGLADVLRRAAENVPDLGTREEADLVATLDALPEHETTAFGGLADFIDAARTQADAFTEQRAHAPLPAMPRAAYPRHRAMVAVMLAAAAVLLLVPAAWIGFSSTTFDAAPATDTSGEAALQSLERDDASTRVVERSPKPRPTPAPSRVPEAAPVPEPTPEEEPVAEPVPVPKRSSPSLSDRLATLDADARAAWKAGDLGLAEDKFREIVRVGRRGRTADFAYGDLFSIARQRADQPGLRRYWKQYAAKFPRGRWIDDARAGLCRTAPSEDRQACWRKYLADRPHGTYKRDAEAALR